MSVFHCPLPPKVPHYCIESLSDRFSASRERSHLLGSVAETEKLRRSVCRFQERDVMRWVLIQPMTYIRVNQPSRLLCRVELVHRTCLGTWR